MKKNILILVLVLCMALAGCANNTENNTQVDETTTSVSKTTQTDANDESAVKTIEVLGSNYIYGNQKTLSFNDDTLEGIEIEGTGVYYASINEALEGTLYGVTSMTYYDYYASELGIESTNELSKLSPSISLKAEGAYDAITSATSLPGSHASDYPKILAYTAGTDLKEDPLKFDGFKTLDVAVDAKLYVEGMILAEENKEKFALANAVSKIILNDDAKVPMFNNNVKQLNKDGLYGASKIVEVGSAPIALSNVSTTSEVRYNSKYGHYLFSIALEGLEKENTESELYLDRYLDHLYGITIEDAKGNIAGTLYYQDVWVERGRAIVEIAVSSGEVKVNGYDFTVNRFDKLFKENTIDLPVGDYKVVLKARGYSDITSNVKVGQRLSEDQHIKIESQDFLEAGNTLVVDKTSLPSDFVLQTYKLRIRRKDLLEGQDFEFNPETMTLTIKNVENTGINQYRFLVIDEKYESAEASFTLNSTMKAEQVSYVEETLKMSEDSPISLEAYLNKLGRVYVWAQDGNEEDARRIWYSRCPLFDASFKLDHKAEYRKKSVFEAGKTYNIKLTAPGFEDVVLEGINIKE